MGEEMTMHRLPFWLCTLLVLLVLVSSGFAAYPDRAVKMIVP